MNLIINADDYGLTKAVNLGILEAIQNGVVTSTTMMANGLAFDHGVALYKAAGGFKVGVHLCLTWGRPICNDLKTLVGADGKFKHRSGLFNTPELFDQEEIRRELYAQVNKVREAGIEVTHLDSHHHAHKVPIVAEAAAEIAKELGIPMRPVESTVDILKSRGVDVPEHFNMGFYEPNVSTEYLLNLLAGYQDGTLELMCHPAYIDQSLMDATVYNLQRALELEILCNEEVQAAISQKGIKLVDYSNYR